MSAKMAKISILAKILKKKNIFKNFGQAISPNLWLVKTLFLKAFTA